MVHLDQEMSPLNHAKNFHTSVTATDSYESSSIETIWSPSTSIIYQKSWIAFSFSRLIAAVFMFRFLHACVTAVSSIRTLHPLMQVSMSL